MLQVGTTEDPSLKLLYQKVCKDERRATVRNTALIKDFARLSHQLSVAADAASHHATRLAALKRQYQENVLSSYTSLAGSQRMKDDSSLQREERIASRAVHTKHVFPTSNFQQTGITDYHGNTLQPDSLNTKPALEQLQPLDNSTHHQDRPVQAVSTYHQDRPVQAVSTYHQDRPVQAVSTHHQDRPVQAVSTYHQDRPVQAVSTLHQDRPVQAVSTHHQDRPVQAVSTYHQDRPVQVVSTLHHVNHTESYEVAERNQQLTIKHPVETHHISVQPHQLEEERLIEDHSREYTPSPSKSTPCQDSSDPTHLLKDLDISGSSLDLEISCDGEQQTTISHSPHSDTLDEEKPVHESFQMNPQTVIEPQPLAVVPQHNTVAECRISESHDDPRLTGQGDINVDEEIDLNLSVSLPEQDIINTTGQDDISVEEKDDPSTTGQDDISVEQVSADNHSSTGQDDLGAIVLHLLSALNTSLLNTVESAHLMYTPAKDSDSMKERIISSDVLASRMISAASQDDKLTSWDVSAMSAVTLQQLAHMSHTVGGLLSADHLHDDSPLLNGPEEMKMQVPNSWKSVWDTLLEHLHLLHRCGRSFNDLVAVFIPSLIPTESLREKARLQLLCVLQPVDDQSSFSEEASEATSKNEVGLASVLRNEEELSLHSSLLSEGSAIDEELLLAEKQTLKENESSFVKTPPISLPPSSLSARHDLDDNSTISDDSSLTPFSPSYVPTAIEQRSTTVPPLKSSLKRKLGFNGDSDSDIDDLPMVTPLGNHLLPSDKDEKEDFDF